MALTIHFIRHGESIGNIDHSRIGGRLNHLTLTKKGEEQAEKLAEFLKKFNELNVVYAVSSPAIRAKTTAEIALQHLNIQPVFDERIVERTYGEWEGQPRELITDEKIQQEIKQLGNAWKPPGGESVHDIIKRVKPAVNDLLEHFEEGVQKHILWFGHGAAIRSIVHHLLETEHLTYRSGMDNTARTVLTYNGEHWYLHRYNDTKHLL